MLTRDDTDPYRESEYKKVIYTAKKFIALLNRGLKPSFSDRRVLPRPVVAARLALDKSIALARESSANLIARGSNVDAVAGKTPPDRSINLGGLYLGAAPFSIILLLMIIHPPPRPSPNVADLISVSRGEIFAIHMIPYTDDVILS